jgi:hypothetical protein
MRKTLIWMEDLSTLDSNGEITEIQYPKSGRIVLDFELMQIASAFFHLLSCSQHVQPSK